MVDFFNEVDEDLRAQETRDLARKYLPWAAGVVLAGLVAAGGYWGWQSWRLDEAGKASVDYERGMTALSQGNNAAADAAFSEAAGRSSTAYKALALMQRAALALKAGNRDQAVKLWDEAAKASKGQPILSDAAALKAAYVLMDVQPYAEVEKRLKPLSQEGRPYRPLALEALAMAKLAAGKTSEARAELVALSLLLDAPDGVRERSQAAIQMIDSGAAAKLPGIARAAAALPPAPEPNPFAEAAAAAAAQQGPQAAPQTQAPAGAPAQ
ncbi:MAG: tetratricopeptide repeat protein [Caulobacteraceae bacterium]|nr:tetratricopeptide repeat protein [Caulobacteraceae bacterium]